MLRRSMREIIGPTFRTKCIRTNHINILGIDNVNQERMHYAYITSVKRLCYSQHSADLSTMTGTSNMAEH